MGSESITIPFNIAIRSGIAKRVATNKFATIPAIAGMGVGCVQRYMGV